MCQIKENLVEIEEKLERPKDKIVEYCDELRNQIDIRTEILIDKLNNFRADMLTELKTYEQKCLKNSLADEIRPTFEIELSENSKKLNNYHKYLNQSTIDEIEIGKMIADAKIQEYNLKNYTKLLDSKLFGPELIVFEESCENAEKFGRMIIGKMKYEDLSFSEQMFNPEKIAQLSPENSFECIGVSVERALAIATDTYLIASENSLKLFKNTDSVDIDGLALGEIRFDHSPEFIDFNGEDLILVQQTRNIWKNNRKEKNMFSSLSVFDLNLDLKHEISPDFTIVSCCSTNHSIFIQTDRGMLINVYNWSLEKITTFGQIHFPENPYYFKESLLTFVKDDRMYFRRFGNSTANNLNETNKINDGFIRVVSLTNGELMNQYSLNLRVEKFFVDNLSRTIVLDEICSKLRIYDRPKHKLDQVELLFEKDVEWLNGITDLRLTDDGRLYFIKNKQTIQYISLFT